MKKLNLIYPIFLLTFLFQGCEENKDQINEGQITMEIDGKNYKSTSIDNFDSLSDTADWNLYPGGSLSIDTSAKYNGASSLKLITETQCFVVERIKGVEVNKDKVYVIHFHYKMEPGQIGDIGYCAGEFLIQLKQGNEYVLDEVISGVNDWTEKYFYFQPINNVPVKIKLLIGTERGVWLDDLILLEEY
jgi:hypothetical protein